MNQTHIVLREERSNSVFFLKEIVHFSQFSAHKKFVKKIGQNQSKRIQGEMKWNQT